jgi:hypothetical protein
VRWAVYASDFIAHRALAYTRSRPNPAAIMLTYRAVSVALVSGRFRLLFALLSLGPGFWGLPCWMHHLIPTIPWCQQIIVHRRVAKILTSQQRTENLVVPRLGSPRTLSRLWTEPTRFMQGMRVTASSQGWEQGGAA